MSTTTSEGKGIARPNVREFKVWIKGYRSSTETTVTARVKFDAMLSAYRVKAEELRFAGFVASHRLSHVFGMEG